MPAPSVDSPQRSSPFAAEAPAPAPVAVAGGAAGAGAGPPAGDAGGLRPTAAGVAPAVSHWAEAGGPSPWLRSPRAPLNLDPRLAVAALMQRRRQAYDWCDGHLADTVRLGLSSMPGLIRKVRLDMREPEWTVASDDEIVGLLREWAVRAGLHLPQDQRAPAASKEELKAAAGLGFSVPTSLEVADAGGQITIKAGGDTRLLAAGDKKLTLSSGGLAGELKPSAGVTLSGGLSPGGAAAGARLPGGSLDVAVDFKGGVELQASAGDLHFKGGVDKDRWEVSLSFGPMAPDLSQLPGLFGSAEAALRDIVRSAGALRGGDVQQLRGSLDQHLPAVRKALDAARAAAAQKGSHFSVGVQASGPVAPRAGGPQDVAGGGSPGAEGLRVMVTLTVTF